MRYEMQKKRSELQQIMIGMVNVNVNGELAMAINEQAMI